LKDILTLKQQLTHSLQMQYRLNNFRQTHKKQRRLIWNSQTVA